MNTGRKLLKKTPSKNKIKNPVKVFCRLRPLQNDNSLSCMKLVSSTTVCLIPPESASNFRAGLQREIQYSFNHVFPENATQKEVFDHVALPIVENLVKGQNGLLFTYGVTGSGKTYTMTGEPKNGGIMPRCLDVLFNSIVEYQAKKYVFKPDKMNGFDIQSEADAVLDRQNEMYAGILTKTPKTPLKKKDSDPDLASRITDSTKLSCVDEDNLYAVYVTYVEIYNNNVYDLLEELPDEFRARTLQSKIIREDAAHNMYVHGVTEVEVKSPEEAFEAFYKGQRKKRMAHTTLNAESSRSHSVFTVRLVQAPLDCLGEAVVQDKKLLCVSQLSLVDLAGSERTNRTKNSGQRLREAGNINNSLMTLRSCLEILRENQQQGTNKMVPYRDSKLTHLFKNFFDGEGQVSMVVCVSPSVDDYDETVQVLKFAELTQEVQVLQPSAPRLDLGLTPGRRKANKMFRQAIQQLDENASGDSSDPQDSSSEVVYSLNNNFPSLLVTETSNLNVLEDLASFLQERVNKRELLTKDLADKWSVFRKKLVSSQKENILSREASNSLQATLDQERSRAASAEARLTNIESLVNTLQRKLNERDHMVRTFQQELADKEMQIRQKSLEKEKVKQEFHKLAAEADKNSWQQQEQKMMQLQSQMRDKEEKLRQMKHILVGKRVHNTATHTPHTNYTTHTPSHNTRTGSQEEMESHAAVSTESNVRPSQFLTPQIRKNGITPTPRRRRSRSVGSETWLDHRPAIPTALTTVMQPSMKKRKSITKLTDAKEVTSMKASKYCLMTQEQDSEGELETRLYKADVLPTTGGGAQVVFNDVETLKQFSPTRSPARKRSAGLTADPEDVLSRCAVSVEGHSKKPRV